MDEHIFMFHVLDMQPKKLIDNVFQWPDGLKSAELCAQIQDQDWEKSFFVKVVHTIVFCYLNVFFLIL